MPMPAPDAEMLQYLLGGMWPTQEAVATAPRPAEQPAAQPEKQPSGWKKEEGIASSHHLIPGKWNELHSYTQATRPTDTPVSLMMGEYLNSEGSPSVYGGVRGTAGPFFGELGGVAGYAAYPMIPYARAGLEVNDALRLWGAPAMTIDGDMGAVLGLDLDMLKW